MPATRCGTGLAVHYCVLCSQQSKKGEREKNGEKVTEMRSGVLKGWRQREPCCSVVAAFQGQCCFQWTNKILVSAKYNVSLRALAFREVAAAREMVGCREAVLSLYNAPWPARGRLKPSVELITPRLGSAPLFDYLLGILPGTHFLPLVSLLASSVTLLPPPLLSLYYAEISRHSPILSR